MQKYRHNLMKTMVKMTAGVVKDHFTFHVPQRETLSSQTIRSSIDVDDRFLSQRDPYDSTSRWVSTFYARYYLVDGFERGLTKSINVGGRDLSEIDCTAHTVVDVVRLPQPLIRLEKGTDEHNGFRKIREIMNI
jgi:hypothetical protein